MKRETTFGGGLLAQVAFVALATGVYGAVLAAWRSPHMAAYVAVKLPAVFVGTTFTVSVFCWMSGLVAGAELRYREVLGAWLFSVSTESVGFIVFFSCGLVAVAVYFAQRPLLCAKERGLVISLVGMRVWFFVLIVVALQSVTLVRPMLSPLGAERTPQGKCFFLEHFKSAILEMR